MKKCFFNYLNVHYVFCLLVGYWVIAGGVLKTRAQDPFFTQFYNAPVYMNSAFAGISDRYTIALNYRNEYPFFADLFAVYNSYSFSVDKFYKKYNSGIGITFSGNSAGNGLMSTLNAAISYSYRVRLGGKNYVRGGLEIGGISRHYGWNKFLFPDQLGNVVQGDPPSTTQEVPAPSNRVSKLDFSFGVLFHHPNYFAGISWKHLNTPDLSVLRIRPEESRNNSLPVRWSLHGGYKWYINKDAGYPTFMSLNMVYLQQASLRQINVTGIYKFSKVFAGLGWRHAFQNIDALLLSSGIILDRMTIGYSFDLTVSSFGIANGGSHELALRLQLGNEKDADVRTTCYSFY